MAQRAEFPDPIHPLSTPAEDAQQQVVERIKRRRKDMGLTVRDVAGKAWSLGHTRAAELLNEPQHLRWEQVEQLADLLQVTTGWLQHGGDNPRGRYEDDGQVVAELYALLKPKDKEAVWHILFALAGEETAQDAYTKKHARLQLERERAEERAARRRNKPTNHERERAEASKRAVIDWASFAGVTDAISKETLDIVNSVMSKMIESEKATLSLISDATARALFKPELTQLSPLMTDAVADTLRHTTDPMRPMREQFDKEHGSGAYDEAMRIGKALEAQGEDVDELTLDDLLERRGDVET